MKRAVWFMVLTVLFFGACSVNGNESVEKEGTKTINVIPSSDPALNAAAPLMNEQELKTWGMLSEGVSAKSEPADIWVNAFGPLYDARAVRGKNYVVRFSSNNTTTNRLFKLVYGYDANNLDHELVMTNTGYFIETIFTVPADAGDTLFYKIVDNEGNDYINKNKLYYTKVYDRIYSYSFIMSYYDLTLEQISINYSGPVADGNTKLHFGWNNWKSVSDIETTYYTNKVTGYVINDYVHATVDVPEWANYFDFAFYNGASWDNNDGNDYHFSLVPAVSIIPLGGYMDTNNVWYKKVGITWQNGVLEGKRYVHYGINGWNDVNDSELMTYSYQGEPSPYYSTLVEVSDDAEVFDCAFFDENGTWENNYGMDWHTDISWK